MEQCRYVIVQDKKPETFASKLENIASEANRSSGVESEGLNYSPWRQAGIHFAVTESTTGGVLLEHHVTYYALVRLEREIRSPSI